MGVRMPKDPRPLTGLAIGDALGMPFETQTFLSDPLMEWDGTFQPGAPTNTLQPERKAGEWTDDTKMALALAESLMEAGTYDPVLAVSHYMEWYESGDHRGIGKTTQEAMERLARGFHWNASGVLHAEGNGTAMRIAPMGLFFRKSLMTVAEMTRIDARITHRSYESTEGAVAVAVAVAILSEDLAPKSKLLDAVINLLRSDPDDPCTTAVEGRLLNLQAFLKNGTDLRGAVKYMLDVGTGAHVPETVSAAFLCFLCTPTFKDAVELAVRAGGDTDTTAAITGALAGAHYGEEQLRPYLGQLELAEYLINVDKVLFEGAPEIPEDK